MRTQAHMTESERTMDLALDMASVMSHREAEVFVTMMDHATRATCKTESKDRNGTGFAWTARESQDFVSDVWQLVCHIAISHRIEIPQ